MSVSDHFVPPAVAPVRHAPLIYLVRAAALMALMYALLYFPYPAGSLPSRLLSWYPGQIAGVSATLLRFFDGGIHANGDLVEGRFSLRIALDCAALDAHALFGSAVLAFPAAWSRRIAGLLVGTAIVALVNVARIVGLYVVGVHRPASFDRLHEEVLQLAIILSTLLVFCGWVVWARPPHRQ